MEVPTRCAEPTVCGVSTYTVLGFVGYSVANVLGSVLAQAWDLTLGDRLAVFLAPPLAFIVVVFAARLILREERIVFYQTAVAGVASVLLVSALAAGHMARCLDVTVVGIGTFLVFGRIGCFSVACCHGRPARFGVVYGPRHVRLGFWRRWQGRRLWPIQLLEAATSAALVVAALALGWESPGTPALVYAVGYGVCRFAFELVRGDATRPHAYGLSEAQLTSVITLLACAAWRPSIATLAAAAMTSLAAAWVALRRERTALFAMPHLREIDRLCSADGVRRESTRGLMISCHALPDGRNDWVLSSNDAAWSTATASRIASALWPAYEVVAGKTPGVFHVITPL